MRFADAWARLDRAPRRALELAHEALASGGLAVGSVLAGPDGSIVTAGRNHAYDPRGGRQILQRTPIAHAELNALAAVDTARALARDTLWSTQEPCSMCAAAATFVGVGHLRFLAPDPWAIAADVPSPTGGVDTRLADVGPAWLVAANLMFLLSVARRQGMGHPTIVRNLEVEPETAGVAGSLVVSGGLGDPAEPVPPLEKLLTSAWERIEHAATERLARLRQAERPRV